MAPIRRAMGKVGRFCRFRTAAEEEPKPAVLVDPPRRYPVLRPLAPGPAYETQPEPTPAFAPPPLPNPHRVEDASLFEDPELLRSADGRDMKPEVIQQWVAAGLLYPDEVRAAEKMMQTLRRRAEAG